MDIKILSPQWGNEHLRINDFVSKIVDAGFDGIDTWLPPDPTVKKELLHLIEKNGLVFVAHQHEATGNDFKAFRTSFKNNLIACAETSPVLINSHTGRDHFSQDQFLSLIDIAAEVAERTNIPIVHETHRGRMGYSPQATAPLFARRPGLEITADLSHWVCVTESMLGHFEPVLQEAITRTRHVHARVGYEQGPQVTDPRSPEWAYALERFLTWWDAIVVVNREKERKILTFTTEFGPFPYMQKIPFTDRAIASQFEINCYMKDLLRKRYIG